MYRSSLKWMLMLALVAALAVASGCGAVAEKAGEKVIEGATGVDIDRDGDSVTFTGEDGESATITQDAKIPESFPSDIPLREGATVLAAIEYEAEGGKMHTINMQSSDTPTEISDWYRSELESSGWEIVSSMQSTGEYYNITAQKDDLLVTMAIGIDEAEDATIITLTVIPQE